MTRTILIVDDEADILRLAQISLSKVGGHEVLTAGSGEECLRMLETTVPDAIILDVMMPILDGPSTLDRIRDGASTFDVPVVFMTAGGSAAEMDRLRALQVSGVLSKPFDPIALPGQLAEVLGWSD
jgi:CheY-like chemotaxis protein